MALAPPPYGVARVDRPIQRLAEGAPGPRASAGEAPPSGGGLPGPLRASVESLSGFDMRAVKVRFNSPEPAAMRALAFTRGAEIHVAPGQERHLAHEAWHVVQQAQGRVKPTLLMKSGVPINDDAGLEREADQMAARAAEGALARESGSLRPLGLTDGAAQAVLQPKMGFELELPVLVDIGGRPVPEKRFLGRYGTENLELQVDHNGDVEGPTPLPAAQANLWSATSLPAIGTIGGLAPNQIEQLGAYDLPNTWETRVDLDPAAVAPVDPRAALASTLLDPARWQAATNLNRFTRPPGASDIGFNNAEIANLDLLIGPYSVEAKNWEPARAAAALLPIITAATQWLAANTTPPSMWHPMQRSRYFAGQAIVQTLLNEANAHLLFWQDPLNAAIPAGLQRQYRRPGGAHPIAWRGRHPLAGQGGERYASILEIVTQPYDIDTPAGLADLITAMTEADQLAADIEVATNNFTNRAQLSLIAHTDIANPATHIGNDNPGQLRGPQSTDASIQSTFAVDLSQIPSLMKSTVAIGAPQQLFGLKHQADQMATLANPDTIYRAEREMMIAAGDATWVINQVKAQIGLGAPSFVNLRGLVTLVCQYLRLGRYWSPGGVQILDKNLTDLLSRTDLAYIYRDAVPNTEKTWLLAHPDNMNFLINHILTRTNRAGATVLFNNPTETRVAAGSPHLQISCQTFVNNVFGAARDGVTEHLGGFQQRPVEDIDPLGARLGDAVNPTVAHPHRMAPVFEMRNMMPKMAGDRFPRADWVPLARYMATMISLLNTRTEAQATQDRRVREQTGPLNATGFDVTQPNW